MSITNMPPFIPGLELSRRFYTEAVRPLLEEASPAIPHSAARLGSGSEVLGFDTPRSADHEWGPRLQLFLRRQDVSRHAGRIRHVLAEHLPKTFHGYPTHFAPTGDRDIRVMQVTDRPVHHRVEVTHLSAWFTDTLGFVPSSGITPTDWLATPTQLLAEVTGGAVFHDGLGELAPYARPSAGTRTTSGSMSWPASGSAYPRRKPSSAVAARSATSWDPPWSPPASYATSCACVS